ncbi:MAG: CDP-alcohol phosphatidyltransferase family protein [Bacillota bacterium]
MRHIPNILSALRVAMVGLFIYLFVSNRMLAVLIVFVAAFLTDLLDGYLARRNGWITDVGKVLDPLADKLMLLTALVCFYTRNWIPAWLLIIVLAKELLMIVGGVLLYRKNVVVYADWFGKSAAGFFNAGVAVTLLKLYIPQIGFWNLVLFLIAMILAIVALVHYARLQIFSRMKQDDPKD